MKIEPEKALSFIFRGLNKPYYGRKTKTERMIKMLNVVIKVAQIAVGVAVGNVASNVFDKVVDSVQKAVEAKKRED